MTKITFVRTFLMLLFSAGALISIASSEQNEKNGLLDSLKEQMHTHLANDEVDSALSDGDLLYKLYQEEGNKTEMIRAKTQRAEILRIVVSLDLALAELQSVEDLIEYTESPTVKAFYFNRLAAIQYERKAKDEALLAVQKSQEFKPLAKKVEWIELSNYNLLGSLYRDREEWDKAIEVFLNIIEASQRVDDQDEKYLAIKNLGLMYYRKGDYRAAINTLHRYLNNDFVGLDRKNISENFRFLGHSYKALNILDSAFIFLDSAHANTLKGMEDIVSKRTDKYRIEAELSEQKLENEILITEGEKSQLKIVILVIVLIFIFSMAGVFFKQKLSFQKLNAKQQELNKELEVSLSFKNKLIAIVAHDIRNPMASLTGILHLYNEGYVNKQDLKEMMSKLEASAVSVNFLVENLLNWVLNQKETLKAVNKPFNLSALVDKTAVEVQSQLKAKGLNLKINGFKSDLQLQSDESMLGLVIRNILSNAIKFSQEGSDVIVSYLDNQSYHNISIKDFGVGMTKSELQSITEGDLLSQTGTKDEKGTGLGITLVKEFLKALGAHFTVNSEKGVGTEFIISLPQKK